MKAYLALALVFLINAKFVLAQSNVPIHTGVPIDLGGLLVIGQTLGGFLLVLGGVLAGITLISSGIFYLTSGANTQRITQAKGIFKGGIIGSLIIFGSGLIITTIKNLAENPFGFFQ